MRRGFSLIEIGVATVVVGVAALAVGSFSTVLQQNQQAVDMAEARRLASRQVQWIEQLAMAGTPPAGRRVEGEPEAFDVSLTTIRAPGGEAFPDIWSNGTSPFVLEYRAAEDAVLPPAGASGAVDRLVRPYQLPRTSAWHVNASLRPDERAYLDARGLAVTVWMAPLEVRATRPAGRPCCETSPFEVPKLAWIMQVDVERNGEMLHRAVTHGI